MELKAKLRRLTSAGPESRPPAGDELAGGAAEAGSQGGAEAAVRPSTALRYAQGERAGDSGHLLKLRRHLEALSARQPAPVLSPAAARALPGAIEQTAHGPLHLVEAWLAPGHRHGQAPIARALAADPRLVSQLALDASFAGLDLGRMLLLDTETTGLAGGTGTLPFLVGLGWFEDGRLRLRQLLLRRPGEEGPMLRCLAEALLRSSCLVSYNGKSFDWPLLRNRFVMNRLPVPRLPPHLDLLHCARRVFRRRLSEMRLVSVEEAVLGHRRVGDIDGSEIPERYFDYLRRQDGGLLAPVIEHNGHDLTALAGLLGTLADRFAATPEGADARDSLGFAYVATRTHDPVRALAFAKAAAFASRGPLAADALALVAQLSRRQGDVAGAAAALEEALRHAGPEDRRGAELHLALAKAYEHRLRDPALALTHARAAAAAEKPADHARRLSRLEARLAERERNGSLDW